MGKDIKDAEQLTHKMFPKEQQFRWQKGKFS